MKYRDVQRFYVQKYGKTIGALKFKVYLLKKQKQTRKQETPWTRTRRINLFVF
jgi:hypothetical protein